MGTHGIHMTGATAGSLIDIQGTFSTAVVRRGRSRKNMYIANSTGVMIKNSGTITRTGSSTRNT